MRKVPPHPRHHDEESSTGDQEPGHVRQSLILQRCKHLQHVYDEAHSDGSDQNRRNQDQDFLEHQAAHQNYFIDSH
jgi:hypothetical protein